MNLLPRSNFFFDDMFSDLIGPKDNFKCDIYEKNNKYYIEMDIPGFTKNDISIDCDNGYLNIKIIKNESLEDEEKNYIRRERISNEVNRSFYIGEVNIDEIQAKFQNGCLILEIPKLKNKESKKIIEIED